MDHSPYRVSLDFTLSSFLMIRPKSCVLYPDVTEAVFFPPPVGGMWPQVVPLWTVLILVI